MNFIINKAKLCKIISPFIFLLIWYLLAAIIAAPLILPFPHQVIIRLFELAGKALFWKAFAFTFLRVITAFILSLFVGFFLGLLAADYSSFASLMAFPLELIRATPVIALILPALFWFTSDIVPVFVALLMCLPIVFTASKNGFEKTPENMEKLFKAQSRGFTGIKAFLHIRLPAASASLFSGAQSAFGLAWKVVAAGEVLSLPHYGTGSVMQGAQVHLETADVLAVTLVLIVTSCLCQFALLKISGKNHKKAL